MDKILVVREYSDVFPNNIPEFLLKKEIEFSIEMVPGMGLIFIAPYKKSLMELAKLKKSIGKVFGKEVRET